MNTQVLNQVGAEKRAGEMSALPNMWNTKRHECHIEAFAIVKAWNYDPSDGLQ